MSTINLTSHIKNKLNLVDCMDFFLIFNYDFFISQKNFTWSKFKLRIIIFCELFNRFDWKHLTITKILDYTFFILIYDGYEY
jgi:hypothetical protein